MSFDKLENQVTKRAEDLVSDRVREFRNGIVGLAREHGLLVWRRTASPPYTTRAFVDLEQHNRVRLAELLDAVSRQLRDSSSSGQYPAAIWGEAEAEVREQIMGIIDPLQKALEAKGGFSECGPTKPEPEK